MSRLLRTIADFFFRVAFVLDQRREGRALRRQPALRALYDGFRSDVRRHAGISPGDAVRLYALVREKKPRRILELGTGMGTSAAIMAQALAENGSGELVTVEQYPTYTAMARERVPDALRSRVRFVTAPVMVMQEPRASRWLSFSAYDWSPPSGEAYDLLLVDGPGVWVQDEELVKLPNGDVFRLLTALSPGALVYVDGRESTVSFMERFLSDYLTLREKAGHALFERTQTALPTDGIIRFGDVKKEQFLGTEKGARP